MHLDHEHRERENVPSFGKGTLSQDLWGGPLHIKSNLFRVVLRGLLVFNGGTRKAGDECMTGLIHKYIRLAERQCDSKTRFRTVTYSFDASMNYIVRVKVVEAVSDVGELSIGVSVGGAEQDGRLRVSIGLRWARS